LIDIVNFEHTKLNGLGFDLEANTTNEGRKYLTPDGKAYPSITTILSSFNKKALFEWRARVGEEEANRVARLASSRGSKLHNTVEKYLLNEMSEMKIRSLMPDTKELFFKLKPFIDESVSEIYGIEQALYSDKLRVAGRCDCICRWNGKVSIVDWKTSTKTKSKEGIANYFMQASAYAEMFEERTGIEINQIVVVISVEEGPPQIFVEDKSNYLDDLHKQIDKYWSSK
jgi:genome maintenance exonuclease 1